MGRKGHDYKVALMVSDEFGYSTELAVGFAPHSVMADEFIHGRFIGREGWERSSPEPATLRVKTDGPRITVFMDGTEVFTVEDDTYSYGATGIIAGVASPIKISDYQLQTRQAVAAKRRWQEVDFTGFVTYPVPRHRVGGWYGNPLLSRMPDGKIVITFIRTEDGPPATWRGENESPAFTFSTDEGKTWSEPKIICIQEGYQIHGESWGAPILIDTDKFDTNECMIAEPEPGKLVSFSRTLRGRFMWTATSTDGGQTWSDLKESSVSGECPDLLNHSSGAIVMISRDTFGNSVRITFDGGKSWTRKRRVPASGMATMVELTDGRVLIAGHTGWSNPTWIHADNFRVTPDGPVAER